MSPNVVDSLSAVFGESKAVTYWFKSPRKLVLNGDSNKIHAKFEPQAEIHFTLESSWHCKNSITMYISSSGEAASSKQGSGEFELKAPLDILQIVGAYKLQVGVSTARLYYENEQIWFGEGKQQGLDGEFSIEFKVASWSSD